MYEMYEMLAVWHAAYYAVNAVFVFPNSDVHHTDRSHYLQTLNSTEQCWAVLSSTEQYWTVLNSASGTVTHAYDRLVRVTTHG